MAVTQHIYAQRQIFVKDNSNSNNHSDQPRNGEERLCTKNTLNF